jgi:SAM-dependent methyltransferase
MTSAPATVLVDVVVSWLAARQRTEVCGAADRIWAVLDVACGPGVAANLLADRAPQAGVHVRVDASYFAPAMVAAAAARLGGRAGRVFLSDAQHMAEVNDAAYDAVVSNFGIFLVPDPVAAVREAARVLRPGGVLAFTLWHADAWATGFMRQLAALVDHDPDALPRLDEAVANMGPMFDPARYLDAVAAAGLLGAEARVVRTASVLHSAHDAVGLFISIPFMRPVFASVAEPGPDRDRFFARAKQLVVRVAGHAEPCIANRESYVITGFKEPPAP